MHKLHKLTERTEINVNKYDEARTRWELALIRLKAIKNEMEYMNPFDPDWPEYADLYTKQKAEVINTHIAMENIAREY